jgi:DNA-binding MarR family transcriptional regulator
VTKARFFIFLCRPICYDLGMTSEARQAPAPDKRADDIARISGIMGRMRLLIGRRYIGRLAINRIGAGLELSHLDLLSLVRRLSRNQEVTVGALAEQMRLDHSRVSRVVADLVKRGVIRREASQEDARRTLVALTDEGMAWLDRMNEVKHEVIGQILSDWSPDDLEIFGSLYERFVDGFETYAADHDANEAAGPE